MNFNADSAKKILVTGAQGALGQRVVHRLLKDGHQITGTFHSKENMETQGNTGVQWVSLDLSHSKEVKSAFARSSFDGLIHCAGGFRYGNVEDVSDEDLDFLFDVNLRSAFYLARELIPGMKKRKYGKIIFISSSATLQPSAGIAAYRAAKSGLNMLTESLSEEVKEFPITVNAILPSVIDSPANRKSMPDADFNKWVTPDQIAEIVASLLSPVGDPIHGALIPVKGRM